MKPDLLPHDADAWLQSCHAPLFPTTVYPTAEQLAERHKLQRKHLSDTRRIFGGAPGEPADDVEDVDCDDESAFAGLRWALTWFFRWLLIVVIAGLCAAIGVGASIWAAAP